MSQSNTLRKQIEDLAEIATQLDDRAELQSQIDRRIQVLDRTMKVLKAKEDREEEEAARRLKLDDANTDLAKRVKQVSDDLGKDADERLSLKQALERFSDSCDDAACTRCALCLFTYLKGKGLTKKQIKLVLGL